MRENTDTSDGVWHRLRDNGVPRKALLTLVVGMLLIGGPVAAHTLSGSNWVYEDSRSFSEIPDSQLIEDFEATDGQSNRWIVADSTVYHYNDDWGYVSKYDIGNDNPNLETSIIEDVDVSGTGYWWAVENEDGQIHQYTGETWEYTGKTVNITRDSDLEGFYWNGTRWYVLGGGSNSVYVYYQNWTYTGTSYDISGQTTAVEDIVSQETENGTHWYLYSQNQIVYKYEGNLSNYSGESYDLSGNTSGGRGFGKLNNSWIIAADGGSRPGGINYYSSAVNLTDVDDTLRTSSNLTLETRSYFQPSATHPYTVISITTTGNDTTREDVTEQANVTSSNTSVLTVNESAGTLTAANITTAQTVVVTANYSGATQQVNVTVAPLSVEYLEEIPTNTWRFVALFGQFGFAFVLVVATLMAVAAARYTSSFAGLAFGTVIIAGGWFGGYVGFGMAAVSVFIALFIGLNVAANIDYMGGTLQR